MCGDESQEEDRAATTRGEADSSERWKRDPRQGWEPGGAGRARGGVQERCRMSFSLGTIKYTMHDLCQLFWQRVQAGYSSTSLSLTDQISLLTYKLSQHQFQSAGWRNSSHFKAPSPKLNPQSHLWWTSESCSKLFTHLFT